MYKEIIVGTKVIGAFKGDTPVSLLDPDYLEWKNGKLNIESKPKKITRKKKD